MERGLGGVNFEDSGSVYFFFLCRKETYSKKLLNGGREGGVGAYIMIDTSNLFGIKILITTMCSPERKTEYYFFHSGFLVRIEAYKDRDKDSGFN